MKDISELCISCLSTDRRTVPVENITILLQDVHFEAFHNLSSGICWECWKIMLNFHRYKKRAHLAQKALAETIETRNLKPLTTLSTKTKDSYDYQFTYNFDPLNNLTKLKKESEIVKVELEYQDDINDNTSDVDEYINEEPAKIETVFISSTQTAQSFSEDTQANNEKRDKKHKSVDTVFTKSEKIPDIVKVDVKEVKPTRKLLRKAVKRYKKNVKSKNKPQTDDTEFKEKFLEVVLTEEQMTKVREEKRNHHNYKKLPFKCDTCVLGFMRKENLTEHMKKKHSERTGAFLCDVCSIRFPSELLASKHRRKHYVCYRCRLCKYEAHEIWSAINHCKIKHSNDKPDRIHCSQCDAIVKSPEDLEEHIQTEHTLYCNECGSKFKGMNTLKRHKARVHAVKRDFICDICKKTFNTKGRLESHMIQHNASIAKKLAYCQICDVQYKNIYVYRSHLKSSANHSERAYPCPECNKKFASKAYWTQHYNFYHLKKSQFKCDECNKIFISDWRLKNHKQINHGLSRPRDHSCNICSKKFFTSSTLRSHKLTHSDQRTFMCEDCGDTFKQSAALYTHTRLVHRGGSKRSQQ